MSKLPDTCFTYVKSENEIGMIKCGETGYYPVKLKNSGTFTEHPQDIVDRMNRELGVTHAEVMAMEIGSMFGWDVPGADPDCWKEVNL